MSDWIKHEVAIKELWEDNAGSLTPDIMMNYLRGNGMITYDCNRCMDEKEVGLSREAGGFGMKECPECTPCTHPSESRQSYCRKCEQIL